MNFEIQNVKTIGVLWSIIFTIACNNNHEYYNVQETYGKWENYSGTKDGARYSSLNQINKTNVNELEVAWSYSTGDRDKHNKSQNQCNPIIINGVLYGTSPKSKLFAIDAATGMELWLFDPLDHKNLNMNKNSSYNVVRGVTYWESLDKKDRRIFYGAGSKIFSINADTGKPIMSFGKNGQLLLSENLDREYGNSEPYVASTSPGIIYQNFLIVSTRVAESIDAAPGHIRAYNTISGKLEWVFHTIPQPGDIGYDSWADKEAWRRLGGANNWAGMSLDQKRGIVYIPTGSVSGDFYGGSREGQNLFGNSLIALKADTGKYLWHFQIVHHDLWDKDLPANPNLVTLNINGRTIDAVAQITKHGYIFIFDRVTGKPVFPIYEKPVPTESLPGEYPWPTQPIPLLPEPFSRQNFTEDQVSNIDSLTHLELLKEFREVKYNEMFTPPSKDGTWIFPGFDGGGEWGGASIDHETKVLYVNSSELPWSLRMVEIPKYASGSKTIKEVGKVVYGKYCMACHGQNLKGNGPAFPSLDGIKEKLNKNDILGIIENGKNMMPAFKQLSDTEMKSLLAFLMDIQSKEMITLPQSNNSGEKEGNIGNKLMEAVPYTITGYNRFLDKNGYPGIIPPWGTLNAVDLTSGKLLWKATLGEYDELTKKGIPPTGTENYGGSVVTKGGLVFIAATKDSKIRAFDKDTGEILWEAKLPSPGFATPAVYETNGKQYLVISCGGGKIGTKSGDDYLAFSLP